MFYEKSNIGVVIDEYREAALFFDSVIPIFKSIDFPDELLPGGYFDSYKDLGCPSYYITQEIPKQKYWRIGTPQDNPNFYDDFMPLLTRALPRFIRRYEKPESMIVPILPDEYLFKTRKTGFELISVISTNVARVNVDSLSWNQIREFREDSESVKTLRNYRLYWYDNYSESSKSYIEDHLQNKYEKFLLVCRKHGFDTRHVILTNIMQSKSMLSASAISLASILAGVPELAIASGTSGIILDIGNTALQVSKSYREKEFFVENHELAYISKVQSRFT